ncbi:MAG: type II toxin-antitoxin system ParD family antitoxin, partial [Thermomicrobiales bacterium]|nr:type II toxin-antitoxin system ParD family antitoxin [Thermomicrobiales bacterium]
TLTPQVEELIRQKLADGAYGSESDVIEDALHALEERDRLIRLKQAIEIADAQFMRGESRRYSSELMTQLAQDAREAIARGDQPKFDVIP